MNKVSTLVGMFLLSVASIPAYAESTPVNVYSLEALQGGWWSDCNDPAVEFFIRGDKYSGDFEGSYMITLTGDQLVFNEGLIDRHSSNVAHKQQAFQIIKVSDQQLVLRPLIRNSDISDWVLRSCKDMPPNIRPTIISCP